MNIMLHFPSVKKMMFPVFPKFVNNVLIWGQFICVPFELSSSDEIENKRFVLILCISKMLALYYGRIYTTNVYFHIDGILAFDNDDDDYTTNACYF